MSLLNQVYGSLKWKRSDEYCAKKLGMSIDKYQELKALAKAKQILPSGKFKAKVVESEEDMNEGTKKIKVVTAEEPKNPEEVEELLKIKNSPVWKLSHYYNKQQSNGLWLITGLVARKKLEPKDLLETTLNNFHPPKYQPAKDTLINKTFTNKTIAVLSVQDLHFGKEGNDITKDFKDAITNLTLRAYHSHQVDEILYVIGGDLLNMDTFSGTTTSGTPVDNDKRAQDAYNDAFEAIYWSIDYLQNFCNSLRVVYLPGNHDRLSSYHLAHAMSKCFKGAPNIFFDVEYSERKVVVYGANFFGFEHGDVTKKNTALLYATEFAKEWGITTYRTCFTGHFHSKKTIEFVSDNEVHGFTVKHLPSLCSSDYWHYHNKFTGAKRQAVLEVHDLKKGKISEFSHNV